MIKEAFLAATLVIWTGERHCWRKRISYGICAYKQVTETH